MPKKTSIKETAAPALVRAVQPSVASPRVKSVKHSKAASAPVAVVEVSAHEQISKIAYGYWAARSFQPGSPEQDWLRAEQEFLSA